MIPIAGLPSFTGLSLVDATKDSQLETIRNSAQHKRAIEHFKENIRDVETVDQLMEDQELYAFVMRAFDLEDQIFGRAMIEKVLKSNIEEPDALVNRLTDPRFREMYETLGFGQDGVGNLNTILSGWQNRMVDRYVERQFINFAEDQNSTVGTALEFRAKASEITNPFQILQDTEMSEFFRTALGIPAASAQLDIDKQAEQIRDKIDLETLQDPEVVENLVRKYIAISDALNGTATANNAALVMLQGGGNASSIITGTLGVSPVSYSASMLYR